MSPHRIHPLAFLRLLSAVCLCLCISTVCAGDDFERLQTEFEARVHGLLKSHCMTCHSTQKREGELDLQRFASVADMRRDPGVWQKVIEMIDLGEMPPKDAQPLTASQREQLLHWVTSFVSAQARATAGDPGPVVLRRLNNVEYTNTVRAITGQLLDPAREFPADSAAGEGFTNTGNSLVMSPALLSKYMDAAKKIADHAVLLPDGVRFSAYATRRDWTDDVVNRIRQFYARYTEASGSTRVNLQGLQWDTNAGGRLPVEPYLKALVASRAALEAKQTTIEKVAEAHHVNAKYLGLLWTTLQSDTQSSLLAQIKSRLWSANDASLPQLVQEIGAWQAALTRFQSVGHMKRWLEPVEPLVSSQPLQIDLGKEASDQDFVFVTLAAGSSGDGSQGDIVIWDAPRLVAPGRVDIPVRDAFAINDHFETRRDAVLSGVEKALIAAEELVALSLDSNNKNSSTSDSDRSTLVDRLASKHGVEPFVLRAWFDYLGLAPEAAVRINELYTTMLKKSSGFEFVNGWGSANTPSIQASSGDVHVRIPGNMKPHGVVVHPSPTLNAMTSWRSPITGYVRVEAQVTHAHPECGNGVTWSIEHRRAGARERLANGIAHGGKPVKIPAIERLRVREGELVSIVVGPRDGNHACDLTDIEFTITQMDTQVVAQATDTAKKWSLTEDVSPDILAGNPHADRFGNASVWNFYAEPIKAGEDSRAVIPTGSSLRAWLSLEPSTERKMQAERFVALIRGSRPEAEGPERLLWDQVHDRRGPLQGPMLDAIAREVSRGDRPTLNDSPELILNADVMFGKPITSDGEPLDANSFAVAAPRSIVLRLPAQLCVGRALHVNGRLDKQAGKNGSVQLTGARSDREQALPPPPLTAAYPIVVNPGSTARTQFEKAAQDFRELFPAALSYTKIVPVDEVVTLALFHREDENLVRLMLNSQEAAELDQLWQELHFVSDDLLTVEDAYEQLMQYATQDSDPKLFAHLREPIKKRADEYRQALLAAQPKQLDWIIDWADTVYRRPLSEDEKNGLRSLYERLRREGLNHESSLRLVIVRMLVSTSFLYRLESSPAGEGSSPVNAWEQASRLSYFLWSSPPDQALFAAARSGKLDNPDQVAEQAARMLKDERVHQLAREFACHWLHIHDLAELNEKSERHFPEFARLKGLMQTEAELYFTDLFRHDRSILSIFDSDHTF